LCKTLPKVLRESADVYAACVAGAMLRDDYLREIESAGFRRVEVVSETSFPADSVLAGSQASEIIRKLKISRKELTQSLGSVISLSVRAVKEE
jgi:hypothetical protein